MPAPVVKPLDIDQRRVRLAPIPLAQAQVPKWCNDNNNSEADWTYVTYLHVALPWCECCGEDRWASWSLTPTM